MCVGDPLPLLHVALAALGSLMIETLVPLVAQGFPGVCSVVLQQDPQPVLDSPQAGVQPSSWSAVLSRAAVSVHLLAALVVPHKPHLSASHVPSDISYSIETGPDTCIESWPWPLQWKTLNVAIQIKFPKVGKTSQAELLRAVCCLRAAWPSSRPACSHSS